MSVDDELKRIFSNPHTDTVEGVLAAGGKLNPDILIFAYDHGVFPWPHEGYPLLWFCPDERGVIEFCDLHLPKSFRKWLKKHEAEFTVTMNCKFRDVMRGCKTQLRQGQKGTWITPAIEKTYLELHLSGHAISVEVERDGRLVGGIYGVQSKAYFSCESMFHLEDNVSKLALLSLIKYLQFLGYEWMDIQMVTSVCESFGGKLISKDDFLRKIGIT